MHKLQTLYTTALAAALTILPGIRNASAGIVVAPLKQEVTVKPGQTVKFHISIANTSRNKWARTQSAHLEVMDFFVTEGGGITFKPPGTVKNSASKWITLSESDLTLAPGEGKQVECILKAPYSATGEAYSAVMVTLGMKGKTNSGVTVGYRTASGIFVTVAGRTFAKQGKILRGEVVWPKQAAGQPTSKPTEPAKPRPVMVRAVLKNTGRVRFEASGEVRINNSHGHVVYRAPMKTKRARVLPSATRVFEAELNKALPQGEYTVKIELDYQSKWAHARARVPMTISADQAAMLARITTRIQPTRPEKTSGPMIKIAPEKLIEKIPPGGFRSLKVVVRNTCKNAARCTTAIVTAGDTPIPASWITLGPDKFTLGEGRSKTLSLIVRVPSGVTGSYSGALIAEAVGADGTRCRREIPVEFTVGTKE